jgi:hypothetical protein
MPTEFTDRIYTAKEGQAADKIVHSRPPNTGFHPTRFTTLGAGEASRQPMRRGIA